MICRSSSSKDPKIRMFFILPLLLFFGNLCCSSAMCEVLSQEEKALIKQEVSFDSANSYYKEGNYKEAVKEYEKIVSNGFESGNLYYNLGNSYFKAGEPGKAILNYERAKRLIPEDADLAANIKYVTSIIQGYHPAGMENLFSKLNKILFGNFKLDGLTIFLSCLYFLLFMILTAGLFLHFIKRLFKFIIPVFVLVIILGGMSMAEKIHSLQRKGVIISREVQAKFEPFDKATTFFELPQGSKVDLIGKEGAWSKIRRFDGKKGWIKSDSIEII